LAGALASWRKRSLGLAAAQAKASADTLPPGEAAAG
jgi:hypothetical protein